MESSMSERLIGVKPETATPSFTASLSVREQLPITGLNLKMFRVAVSGVRAALQFFNGIDGLALDSRDKEQTERREEVNNMLASSPSESEPSASDSDGHGARVIPPSNHPVDDTNGSALNRSPLHSTGSHDYNSFDYKKEVRVAVKSVRAALQFFNGIDGWDVASQDKEQTERPEEVNNIGSSYYGHQCDQVSVTVGVDITCPLGQGCFIEEYGGVSSLHPAMPSESEPSATDSDGHGTRVIPPNQMALDIVDDTNGSALNRSPFHSFGSHDYNSYGQTHQAPGHDDSNPRQSLLLSNSVPGHVGPYDSRLEQELSPRSMDANSTDQSHHGTRVTASEWIFSATGLGFEAVSAFFDQVSSPQKPHYALYGMLLSVVAVLVCIFDLIHNAIKPREVASASEMLWGILPEIFGLALACIQCISSALQFSFLRRHAANPVKVSLVPFLFFFVLFSFKYRNGRN